VTFCCYYIHVMTSKGQLSSHTKIEISPSHFDVITYTWCQSDILSFKWHFESCMSWYFDSMLLMRYGVATISRLLQILGLFCKRALSKRLYSAQETYNFNEPTNRSHPIACCSSDAKQALLMSLRTCDIKVTFWVSSDILSVVCYDILIACCSFDGMLLFWY